MKDIEKIVKEYRVSASGHWKASHEGDIIAANKYYARLKKNYHLLQNNIELRELLLPKLMNDNNYAVQMWASAHSLGLDYMTDEAVKKLYELTILPVNEAPSFEAKMTLQVWKDTGKLTF